MKILVPVDFYQSSFSAYSYACHLSKELDAELTLLHVIPHGLTTKIEDFDPNNSLETNAAAKLEYFTKQYPSELGVFIPKVDTILQSTFGSPAPSILLYADQKDVDLIIMGTRDKHNIFDRILGSTSSSVIDRSECPVMLIHENTKYNKPNHIAFAYDDHGDLENAIDDFDSINSRLQAKTDFIHIYKDNMEDLSSQNQTILDELFDGKNPKYSFEIKAVQGSDVQTSLMDYCLFNKIDILTMMHRKKGFLNKLFSSSDSISMAHKFHLPVLVFNEDS